MDAARRGIWCFYLTGNDPSASVHPEQRGLGTKIAVCGYQLGLVEEGNLEPLSLFNESIGLLKSRLPGAQALNTPSSSSSSASAMDSAFRGAQPFGAPPGTNPAVAAAMLENKYPPMPMSDSKGYNSVPAREMYEFFITAVLSSLSASFCHQIGAIALNHRTVLLPSQAFQLDEGDSSQWLRTSALATFRVYLTTTGSLVISVFVSLLQGLTSSANTSRISMLPTNPMVLAAPLGAFGLLQGVVDGDLPVDNGYGQSPDTQISRLRPEPSDKFTQWKNTCSKLLQMRGMSPSLLDGCLWLTIHFVQKKPFEHRADGKRTPLPPPGPVAPWPSVLCFRKARVDALPDTRLEKMFSSSTALEPLDPLNDAKAWCLGQPERDSIMKSRKKERDEALTRESATADTGNHQFNASSPLTLRRSSNGATTVFAGTMYPTPPDAVQQPQGAVPFETAVISPGTTHHQVPAHAGGAVETTNHSNNNDVTMADSYNGGSWDGTEIKREQQATSFLEGDNMFGDLGEDLFEGNELTDADFNFFDEQPDGVDLDLTGLPDMQQAMDMTLGMTQSTAEVPSHAVNSTAANDQRNAKPISPEFTKPELKHARSSMLENRQLANQANFNANSSVGIKRNTSPFNPDTVYKRIRASFSKPILQPPRGGTSRNGTTDPPRRRSSVFEKVDFDPSLSLVAKKYQESGPFNFTIPTPKDLVQSKRLLENGKSPASLMNPMLAPPGIQQRNRKILKNAPAEIAPLLVKVAQASHISAAGSVGSPATTRHGGDDLLSAYSDVDNASWGGDESDPDDGDTSDDDSASEPPSSPAKSAAAPATISMGKRRAADDDVISMAASFKDLENATADSPAYGSIDLARLSVPDVPELSMTKYFADPEPAPLRMGDCSDTDYMTIAQILTEQAALGTLRLIPSESQGPAFSPSAGVDREVRRSLANAIRYSVQGLRKALPRSLDGAESCQLRSFVNEVSDIPLPIPVQGSRNIQPRTPTVVTPGGGGLGGLDGPVIFQIQPPHITLRRYEIPFSFAPSAISFWEILGLGPAPGTKDVVAVCVHPHGEGVRDGVVGFLDRVRSFYESFKMGTFTRLQTTGNGIVEGLIPFGGSGGDHHMHNQDMASPGGLPGLLHGVEWKTILSEHMERLGQALANAPVTEKNFVVFFVYEPDRPASILDACAAFQEIYEVYKRCMAERKRAVANDLVLQLVPMDLVASETSVVVLSPAEYIKLCLEMYDRCTLFGGPMPAPAIMLEPALPKTIDFKLAEDPSPNLLHENSCVHVAYAQSVDERWVTAAWTDNRGSRQMTASYCLGRRGKPLSRQLDQVVREIWETTHDVILSEERVHWRVIVTKCGPMDANEVETWMELAAATTAAQGVERSMVQLTLMAVDTNPSLQLVPPVGKIPVVNAGSVFYTTPVSTPQAGGIMSPDQNSGGGGGQNPPTPMGGATTPGGASNTNTGADNNSGTDPEADSTLVDVTETTWGVVTAQRLNNSTSLTDLNPALASGYLIKRSGTRAEDPPVAMEVNLVHAQPPLISTNNMPMPMGMTQNHLPGRLSSYELLLKEMLGYFRGLGTLARARGVVEKETDVRPWHVAAAEKGVRALYQLM